LAWESSSAIADEQVSPDFSNKGVANLLVIDAAPVLGLSALAARRTACCPSQQLSDAGIRALRTRPLETSREERRTAPNTTAQLSHKKRCSRATAGAATPSSSSQQRTLRSQAAAEHD